ncbi:MAG: RdgB/HAM1 family non-canonical purine NTP pyrophosphatase [Lachnospiraceae bacterium]|nr:RdgB/HAM1 family non-canonical purine NTP pyrophosphatase [Lachnospiraceae bacterium]MEE1342837.1 RdgB/HAM1 family non-canonical purine NTP pyrophosphatase [Lachnospiraceae bacterium]
MKKIIFATGNQHKMEEIKSIMADLPYEILSMKEAGISIDIEENGTTFEENSLIKARAIMNIAKEIVLADDSGLEVDALNKEPGIYSSRYLGEDTPYEVKNQEIIKRLEGVEEEKRTARFVCAVAAVFPDGREVVKRGTVEGIIGYEAKGENGFGYDPIFIPENSEKTLAQFSSEEKNQISHRKRALEQMKEVLS